MRKIMIIFLLALFSLSVFAFDYNNPLTRSVADSVYCKLTGCAINGNLTLKGINLNNQTNNGFDSCTLASGTCTISNNRVTANTGIFCMSESGLLNLGSLSITSRTAGVSYVVASSNVLQSTSVSCILIEPVIN